MHVNVEISSLHITIKSKYKLKRVFIPLNSERKNLLRHLFWNRERKSLDLRYRILSIFMDDNSTPSGEKDDCNSLEKRAQASVTQIHFYSEAEALPPSTSAAPLGTRPDIS